MLGRTFVLPFLLVAFNLYLQRRIIPAFAPTPFRRWWDRDVKASRATQHTGTPVMLFVDFNTLVVGYGLDYRERYRNLRDIGTLPEECVVDVAFGNLYYRALLKAFASYLANGEIGVSVGQWKTGGNPKILKVEFSSQPGFKYDFTSKDFAEEGNAVLDGKQDVLESHDRLAPSVERMKFSALGSGPGAFPGRRGCPPRSVHGRGRSACSRRSGRRR